MFMHSVMHSHKYYMQLNTVLCVTAVRLLLYLLLWASEFALWSQFLCSTKKKKEKKRIITETIRSYLNVDFLFTPTQLNFCQARDQANAALTEQQW